MTFWETVERGEYVMIALAVLFIFSICLWWIRGAKLKKQTKSYSELMLRVRDLVVEGDVDNALQICDSVSTPGARIIESGLRYIGKPMPEVSSVMQERTRIEKETLRKGCRWLRAIAIIAPLLGLGGTLVGVIDRLRDLGESEQMVDLSMLCHSISPTIVTTVSGLGVGIFALIAYTFLEGTIDSSGRQLDELSSDLTGLLNEPS